MRDRDGKRGRDGGWGCERGMWIWMWMGMGMDILTRKGDEKDVVEKRQECE